MKLKRQVYAILWISTLFISSSVRADDAAMQGVMGIMRMMQQQSGAGADPGSAAMMDAIGKAVDGAHRDRKDHRSRSGQEGRGERQRDQQGYGDSGRGERQRGQQGYGDSGRGERQRGQQGYGDSGRGERQRGNASASAGGDRRRRD